MNRLLVCVDLTESASVLLASAASFGASELHVLHVADPEPDFVGNDVDTERQREVIANKLREAHRAVEAMASELAERGVPATAHFARGNVPATILERAAALDASAIVIGSNREHRLRKLVVGSITDHVLRKATLPVIVVPVQPPSSG